MKRNLHITLTSMFFALLSLTATAQVASNPPYTLEQSVIAGGGQNSAGGTFALDGTIGQSAAGNALSGSPFAVTSGFWTFTSAVPEALGFEADIAGRPSGDSLFKSDDLIQLRRFLNGADTPDSASNEFQRADSAPYSSKGDGALCSSDLIQLRRFLNGADAPQTAGGPTAQTGTCAAAQTAMAATTDGKPAETAAGDNAGQTAAPQAPEVARELRVESPPATSAGQTVTINIRVDALGDEAAYSFRLNYNQTVLTSPVFDDGTTRAAIVDCDASVTNRIGCTIEAFPVNQTGSSSTSIKEIGAGDNQLLLSITFTVAQNAQAQTVPLTLSNVSTSNDRAQNLAIAATNGAVTVTGPTAAMVTIGGRVLTPSGRGITGIRLSLTDSNGQIRTVTSAAGGYYRFENVEAGATYILSASGKHFTFSQPAQVLDVNEETDQVNFIANSEKRLRGF